MKILYKIFIFCVILRMMPIVVASMGIFPSTTLANLGYDFSDSKDIYSILMEIVTPNPISLGNYIPVINSIPYLRDILSIQFGLYILIGIIGIIGIFRYTSLPALIAVITALLIVPFIVDVGMVFYGEAESYHSTPLNLMIISILVGVLVLGILTLLEMSKSTDQGVED